MHLIMHIIHLLSNYSKTTMPLAQPEEKVTSFVYRSPVWKLSFIGGVRSFNLPKVRNYVRNRFSLPYNLLAFENWRLPVWAAELFSFIISSFWKYYCSVYLTNELQNYLKALNIICIHMNYLLIVYVRSFPKYKRLPKN